MENASKALIIAGGILITLMILALVLYVGRSMGDMADSQDRRLAAQQLVEFNKSYEAYNKTRMYGTDVLSVYNKANNEKEHIIEVKAVDQYGNEILVENSDEFKRFVFKCLEEEIKYNGETGVISKMVFKKIEIKK